MAYSLLAHLYPHIKGSQEDIATYSLNYLLEQSEALNGAFTKLICNRLMIKNPGNLVFRCQDADGENGRPDMAGYCDGTLKLLCEAKFYAGLTGNQPVSYLKRLKGIPESGLIFICPEKRKVSLWYTLKQRAASEGFVQEVLSENAVRYNNTSFSIITWGEIIADFVQIATESDQGRLSDIRQLEGFCNKIDEDSFVPFKPEDFGPQVARDIERYYLVVDRTRDTLMSHKELNPSTNGLKSSTHWHGHTRYILLNGYGVSIDFLRVAWMDPATDDSPFWCYVKAVKDGKWITTPTIEKYYASLDAKRTIKLWRGTYEALVPKPYLTLDESAEDLANQIIAIVKKINELEAQQTD